MWFASLAIAIVPDKQTTGASCGRRRMRTRALLQGAHTGTAAGTDDRVAGLVYIAALALNTNETSQRQQAKFPVTNVFSHIEVADGRVWMLPDDGECFAGDLSEQEQEVVWATHFASAADLFIQKPDGVAWKSKASSYIVDTNDRTVQPELQRFVAKRMGATTHQVASSHVPMLSHPQLVIDVIRNAKAAQEATAA